MEKKEFSKLYEYCKQAGVKDRYFKQCADKIIASGNAEFNFLFAKDIPGADIKGHGQAVIQSQEPKYNFYFAYNIKGADIKAHGQSIIDSKDPFYNYRFAREIMGADIKAHENAVIKSNELAYCYHFANDIPGADIKRLQQAVFVQGTSHWAELFLTLAQDKAKREANNKNPNAIYPKTEKMRKFVLERKKVQRILSKPEGEYSKKEGDYSKTEGKTS